MNDEYYAIVIDTDSYSGNFEREMTSFCTGQELPRGEDYIIPHEVKCEDWWEENMYQVRRDESWEEGCSIWETPGWSNDGMGKHTKLKPGEKRKWPAYQSVAMFTTSPPPKEVIDEVWERAQKFSDYHLQLRINRVTETEPIKVTGMRLIHIAIKETHQEQVLHDFEAA